MLVQRVVDRHQQIRALIDEGWTISAVARRLGMDRKTVRRYARADPQALLSSARDRSSRPLDPFKPHLQQRFAAGCTTAARLFREIRELGFEGSRQVVDRYVRTLREGTAPAEAVRPVPSPREITSWIMRPRGRLARDETDRLDQVRLACPDITAACDLARVFHDLMQDRRGTELAQWVRLAERDGPAPVRGFAGFLRQDWAAVLAAFTLPLAPDPRRGT